MRQIDVLNAKQHGQYHPRWKGGRLHWGKYIIVHAPWHPRATIGNRYIFEHRLIMERHINRELWPDEEVHHLNGDKTDNRIENLLLTTKSEHSSIHGKRRDMAYIRSYKLRRGRNVPCATCGTLHYRKLSKLSPKKVYCSFACRRRGTQRTCQQCHVSFYVSPSHLKTRKYCSRVCFDVAECRGRALKSGGSNG